MDDWRLFIDGSQTGLKVVMLHNDDAKFEWSTLFLHRIQRGLQNPNVMCYINAAIQLLNRMSYNHISVLKISPRRKKPQQKLGHLQWIEDIVRRRKFPFKPTAIKHRNVEKKQLGKKFQSSLNGTKKTRSNSWRRYWILWGTSMINESLFEGELEREKECTGCKKKTKEL